MISSETAEFRVTSRIMAKV